MTATSPGRSCEGRAWPQQLVWFPLAYVLFGGVGVFTSIGCFALSLLLPTRWGRPWGQTVIQRLFAFFVWYLQRTGLASFDFHDLASLRDRRGIIIAVNHPSLLDAVFVVSRLPRVFCLMKAGILSNLVLCGTARLAGYVDNHSGKRMVERCVARLLEGDSLVIFPEGTRTVESGVNSFKMGFALIAKLARAPVQTVFIRANSPLLSKHWPLFKPPDQFPLSYSLELGRQFAPEAGQDPKEFGTEIENYFRDRLARCEGQRAKRSGR
jgi:1-acyl-sn-glycerol-3-phosphate acyltransferase